MFDITLINGSITDDKLNKDDRRNNVYCAIEFVIRELGVNKNDLNIRIIFSDNFSSDMKKYKKDDASSDNECTQGEFIPVYSLRDSENDKLPLIILNDELLRSQNGDEYLPTIIHEMIHYFDDVNKDDFKRKFNIDTTNRHPESYSYTLLKYFVFHLEYRAIFFETMFYCEAKRKEKLKYGFSPVNKNGKKIFEVEYEYLDMLARECGKIYFFKKKSRQSHDSKGVCELERNEEKLKDTYLTTISEMYEAKGLKINKIKKPLGENQFDYSGFCTFIKNEICPIWDI